VYKSIRDILKGSLSQKETLGRSVAMSDGEAREVALLLLEKVCGVNQLEALLGSNKTEGRENELLEKARRVAEGEPVQYVIGEADFCGLTLGVEPGVLIPRSETEEIVKRVVEMGSYSSVLDVCTGSGCIAIALAKMMPGAEVEAWDVSDDALRIAEGNAKSCGADVKFRKVNVLNDEEWCVPCNGQGASLVISNPPYICNEEAADMDANVLDHEPHIALFVPDDDPLLFYRKIAERALHILYNKGHLVFEINRRFGADIVKMLKDLGYENVTIYKDMFGNDRMVDAVKTQ